MTHILIYFGMFLALVAEIRYIYSIFLKETKPNFVPWVIFTVSMSLVFFSSYSLGARESLPVIATFTFLHLCTAIISLYYKSFKVTYIDYVTIFFVMLSVLLWVSTHNPLYTLILNVIVDICGYTLFWYKTYLYPISEDIVAWLFSFLAYGVNVLLLTKVSFEEAVFSVSNILCILVLLLFMIRKKSSQRYFLKNIVCHNYR